MPRHSPTCPAGMMSVTRRRKAARPEDSRSPNRAMLRFCPNLHFMYREHPFLERFAAAARDGFTAVEMTFPYDEPADRVRAAADAAGVRSIEFKAPSGTTVNGLQRGLAAVPGRSEDYLAQIRTGIDYARAFDCRLLLSLAGVVL